MTPTTISNRIKATQGTPVHDHRRARRASASDDRPAAAEADQRRLPDRLRAAQRADPGAGDSRSGDPSRLTGDRHEGRSARRSRGSSAGRARKEVSSPVGIVQGSSEAYQAGSRTTSAVLGLISLALALLNLLPLLPLDGGHIVISILEGDPRPSVRRSSTSCVSAPSGSRSSCSCFYLGLCGTTSSPAGSTLAID